MSDDYETIGRELDREVRFGLPNPPVYEDRLCQRCRWYRPLEDFDGDSPLCKPCAEEEVLA